MSEPANGAPALTPLQQVESIYAAALESKEKGELQEAYNGFSKCIEASPGTPAFRLQLSLVACEMARSREPMLAVAMHSAQEAARMAPKILGHWIVLGEVALNCNKFPEACAAYEKALDMEPQHAFIWAMLGFAYSRNGNVEMAKDACEEAVRLDPELGTAHFLLSCFYYEKYWNPSKVAFHGERGFEAKKPAVMAIESMWNAAHGFLLMGNYPKGFTYYEARLRPNLTNANQVLPLQRYPKPLWRGERGTRVLVQTEMGLGDAFIMMRYLPLMKKQFGCDVIFECHGSMLDLAKANFPGVQCVAYGDADPEAVDFQIPIMSLPLIFKTRSYTVPWDGPYLHADHMKLEEWRGRVKLCHNQPNIGICWFSGRNSHSSDNHETSKRKSVPFDLIKPLLDTPGVNFISLQAERDSMFENPGIKDFSDTAALIKLVDVVISVDTAVANLAGGMGANLWLMDRFDHCWRFGNIKTPWFPTTTIYRQTTPRDWKPVIEKIHGDILGLRDRIAA